MRLPCSSTHPSTPSSQTIYVSEDGGKKYKITCTSLYLKKREKRKKKKKLFSSTESISILCSVILFALSGMQKIEKYLFNFNKSFKLFSFFPPLHVCVWRLRRWMVCEWYLGESDNQCRTSLTVVVYCCQYCASMTK